MAPGYRANNQSRRANRSYVDHDVFEGLPVRNWRRDTVTVAPPPVHEISAQKDKWDVELPWGMPKDSHLLPQHSQDLLRAARSGRLYVRRLHVEEEEVDVEANSGDKPEKKEEDPKEKGFPVKTWKLVSKHQEGPEIEFLAKRRKGLGGTAVKTGSASGPTMTKARVRRTDAAGNSYVEDVVIAEGQVLEGELISQTVIVDTGLGKLAVDTVPPLPTPPRRRPPPPKRKAKGPGRGRKRKLPLAPTSVPGETGEVKTETEIENSGALNNSLTSKAIKREDSETANNENETEDLDMGDDTLNPSDEEGEDVSDEDDQSEGDGHGDHNGEDPENIEAKHPEFVQTETNESADATADDHGGGQDHDRDTSSSPELPLATIGSTVVHEHGSPLRNVVTYTSTFEDRSPDLISDGDGDGEAEAEGEEDEVVHNDVHHGLQGGGENRDMQEAYPMHQDDGYPTEDLGDDMQMEQNQDYMDDDEMLLDGDMSGMDYGDIPVDNEQYPEAYPDEDVEEIIPVPVQGQQDRTPHPDHQMYDQEPRFSAQDSISDPSGLGPPDAAREDEEDNFEDLLGSLEDHLNEQGPGLEAENPEEIATLQDEVDSRPTADQLETSASAPDLVKDTATHLFKDEDLSEKSTMEESTMDSNVDIEAKEEYSEESERHIPEPMGQE